MSDAGEYFDAVAEQWDAAIVKAELSPSAAVAHVGTGTGFVLQGPVGRAAYLVGFDESPAMLAVAR